MAVGSGVLEEGAGRAPPHLPAPGDPLGGLASISGLKEKTIDRWSSREWVTIGWGSPGSLVITDGSYSSATNNDCPCSY